MKFVLISFAALSLLVTVIPAKAGQCVTTCRDGFNGQRVCTTNCF
jgi:hypothetical protein